jgi:hypothetical protein
MTQDLGASSGPGSREPSPDGLGPSGFDPSRVQNAIKWMTKTQPKALLALPPVGVWATASEMKHRTSSASLDILYIMRRGCGLERYCDRRWTRWGAERGQRRGEGYEYTITAFGEAVRAALRDSDGSPEGGDADAAPFTTARAEGIAK